IEYSSQTINRLASISKAVAGVLALDLEEKGLLDVERRTDSYTGEVHGESIPSHHTHTLLQLLSNRGGVKHYPTKKEKENEPASTIMPVINGSFNTALEASAELWHVPLVGPPGDQYHYTTHGYTLLGAAIEGALGLPIQQVIQQHLTDAYDLGTLRVEDLSEANSNRSTVYVKFDTGTRAVAADDLSWKVLGGGLEASVYDLTRFGWKVINGEILSEAARAKLWTEPPPTGAGYALGWELGTDNGMQWVGKDGAQPGANTYLLMYPSQKIVVAVMVNRRENGNAERLAREIAELMLDDVPALALHQNIRIRQDVDDDGRVALTDVLACVQGLRRVTEGQPSTTGGTTRYLDVNGDQRFTIADLLDIVAEVRRGLAGEGEAPEPTSAGLVMSAARDRWEESSPGSAPLEQPESEAPAPAAEQTPYLHSRRSVISDAMAPPVRSATHHESEDDASSLEAMLHDISLQNAFPEMGNTPLGA
ncbi:MAG: serine hydrolase, partial [Planctomycetes bacterium]|nr:serine hydrolase [Planctomycetota bacterium]